MSLNKRLIETAGLPPVEDGLNITTWTGNYSTQTISGYGFQPDLVWIKNRNQADSHCFYDSTRGANKRLETDTTDAQVSASNELTSFTADGFSLGNSGLVNASTISYVGWGWRANGGTTTSNTQGSVTGTIQANQDTGFSIIQYTGDGGGIGGTGTVGHGLGAIPRFVIGKSSSAVNSWICYLHDGTNYWHGYLDGNSALTQNGSNTQIGTPNATTIGLSHAGTNQSGVTYMYWAWTPKAGYSKFGSYSGGSTGSSNEITIGFQPDWILIRRTDVGDDWTIIDSVRGDGASSRRIIANTNGAEKAATSIWFPTSTGFYFSGTGDSYNKSGGNYIYAAFRIAS